MASFDFFKSGAGLCVCVMWHLDVVFMKSAGFCLLVSAGEWHGRSLNQGARTWELSTRSSLLYL